MSKGSRNRTAKRDAYRDGWERAFGKQPKRKKPRAVKYVRGPMHNVYVWG